jgi:hypothetical protein
MNIIPLNDRRHDIQNGSVIIDVGNNAFLVVHTIVDGRTVAGLQPGPNRKIMQAAGSGLVQGYDEYLERQTHCSNPVLHTN